MNIPEGFKLVPVEPTEDMLEALHDRVLISVNSKKREANILNDKAWWAAVVQAAPTPPKPIYDEAKELDLFEAWYGGYTKQGWSVSKAGTRAAWLACAQSRAKSVEVGDE